MSAENILFCFVRDYKHPMNSWIIGFRFLHVWNARQWNPIHSYIYPEKVLCRLRNYSDYLLSLFYFCNKKYLRIHKYNSANKLNTWKITNKNYQ